MRIFQLCMLLALVFIGPSFGADRDISTAPAPPPAIRLDKLYTRLAITRDLSESEGIALAIGRIQMRSGSPTADLLMSRATLAMNTDKHKIAEQLLDQIVTLKPKWAEAWNKRATLRFLDNDDAGSMQDIAMVLKLEPRHFGALTGMGFIMQRHGLDKDALAVFRRTLEIDPMLGDIARQVKDLTRKVEGSPI